MDHITITDKYGKPRNSVSFSRDERMLISFALRYFGEIIHHLERKKAAPGSASGMIYDSSAPAFAYKPRISFDITQCEIGGEIDILLYASYAHNILSVRYTEDDGFNRRYYISLEWPAIIQDEAGYGFYEDTVRTQEEVVEALRYRLKRRR